MIATLYGCGLRSYELCNLQLSDIDFERQNDPLSKTKKKTDIYVPPNNLAYVIKKHFYYQFQHIYFNSQSRNSQQLGITTTGVNLGFKEAKSKLQVKKISFHTLRHPYATLLLEQGVDLIVFKNY